MQDESTEVVADPEWDEPKTTSFTHAGYLRGYAAFEITLAEGVDPHAIRAALDEGQISFSKMVAQGYECGPLLYRSEIVGYFRISDLSFGLRPTEGWGVIYYPDGGEFAEFSPGGSWHY